MFPCISSTHHFFGVKLWPRTHEKAEHVYKKLNADSLYISGCVFRKYTASFDHGIKSYNFSRWRKPRHIIYIHFWQRPLNLLYITTVPCQDTNVYQINIFYIVKIEIRFGTNKLLKFSASPWKTRRPLHKIPTKNESIKVARFSSAQNFQTIFYRKFVSTNGGNEVLKIK